MMVDERGIIEQPQFAQRLSTNLPAKSEKKFTVLLFLFRVFCVLRGFSFAHIFDSKM